MTALTSTTAEAREATSLLEKALYKFNTSTKSNVVGREIRTISTSVGVGTLTNIEDAPWDIKVIKNVKRKSDDSNSWIPLTVIDSLETVEQLKLQEFSDNRPQYVYVQNTDLKILPIPTEAYDLQIHYDKVTPLLEVEDLTNITTFDAEGDLVLVQIVEAYYLEKKQDPRAQKALIDAVEALKVYQERNNGLSKRKGKAGRLHVRVMSGDRQL